MINDRGSADAPAGFNLESQSCIVRGLSIATQSLQHLSTDVAIKIDIEIEENIPRPCPLR